MAFKFFPLLSFLLLLFSSTTVLSAESNLKMSGFLRLVAGQVNGSDATYYGYDDSLDFDRHSLLGIQARYDFNDKLSATALGVLNANSDIGSDLQWLYLNYQATDALSFKLGRLQTPFYSYSDVLDVGYAYPWLIAPRSVYNDFIFKNFDGIDIRYSYGGERYTLNLEFYTGQFDGEIDINEYTFPTEVKDLVGGIASLRYDAFTFRAGYHKGDVAVGVKELPPLRAALQALGYNQMISALSTNGEGEFYQLSVQYDSLLHFLKSEWTYFSPNASYYASIKAAYITYGKVWEEWTGLITYSRRADSLDAAFNEIPLGVNSALDQLSGAYYQALSLRTDDDYTSWTLGARWDFRENMALKMEYSVFDVEHVNNSTLLMPEGHEFDGSASLLLFALEWVF